MTKIHLLASSLVDQIAAGEVIDDLNTLTNNGKNCRDLFTNQYYVNNFTQDKVIAEEEKQERLDKEIQKQRDSNN